MVCTFFALAIITIGVAGIAGVDSTADVSNRIVTDELATADATAHVGRAMDTAHIEGDELLLTTDPKRRAQLERALYDVALPRVDDELARLLQLHAGDEPAEKATLRRFTRDWAQVRDLLRPSRQVASQAALARLDSTYQPVSDAIDALLDRESTDAQEGQAHANSTSVSTTWLVVLSVGVAILAAIGIAVAGVRRIRRAVEPENEQLEFAELLQMTEGESEAHRLLKQHLQRALPGTDVTVLNRNNSANRLEAVTPVAADSCLADTLPHAEPRSCLAIRSGHPHGHDAVNQPLLTCEVCGHCPGATSCTPLTVSGEVIGSVLLAAPKPLSDADQHRVRESVGQAAPVLANLRNLALAEFRAATDPLTGLPNKRAIADTIKRMLAHASRSLTPLSVLMIDLDHFKAINDRFGHPVGDQALASAASAITAAIRASDFAGRNGGEEFVVLLPDTGLEGAVAAAEKIRLAIAGVDPPGGETVMTASLGIAVYPDHAMTTDRLERLADAALYTAKRAGRNRCEVAEATHEGIGTNAGTCEPPADPLV
jgi:diguanylate cyclase (GGDEF)-like protein